MFLIILKVRNDNILDSSDTLPSDCAIASQMLDITSKVLIAKHSPNCISKTEH